MHVDVYQKGENSPYGSGPGEALVNSTEKQIDSRLMFVPENHTESRF